MQQPKNFPDYDRTASNVLSLTNAQSKKQYQGKGLCLLVMNSDMLNKGAKNRDNDTCPLGHCAVETDTIWPDAERKSQHQSNWLYGKCCVKGTPHFFI